ISHNRFNADFGRLVSAIERVLEKADAGREQREETPRPTVTTNGERRAGAAIIRGNTSYNKKEYDKAIRLDPSNARAYRERSRAYHGKNEYDKAISDSTEAIHLDPTYALAYMN